MRATLRRLLAAASCVLVTPDVVAEPRFEDYEIRVIRPRFFSKRGRLEVTGGLGAIVNQTFIYSVLATGLLTWHFTETLALEGQAAMAANLDREDKRVLKDRFGIKTILLRPESLASGRLVWTPSYGKFHLTSSRIAYFETHVTLGAGTTGIRYLYDHCDDPEAAPPPSARTVQYPTLVLGAGQRYFVDDSSSFRLGFELQRFAADRADNACGEGEATGTLTNDNLLLFVAWSHYL